MNKGEAPLISLNQEGGGDPTLAPSSERPSLEDKPWLKNASRNTFVRGMRPQSAPMSRKSSSGAYSLHALPTGAGMEAVRRIHSRGQRRKKSVATKKKRPMTAPLRGRSTPRENISKQLLKKELRRRDLETAQMLHEVKEQQELYNRGCVAKMHEASRYAQALGLGKKYNPIHIAEQADSDQLSINHKELRCEIASRDEKYSRIISCQMFLREYAKLVKMHRKAAIELDKKSKQARSVHEKITSTARSSQGLRPPSRDGSAHRDSAADTEEELRLLLQETKDLTQTLKDQMKLIKACGWNLQLH